MKLLLLACDRAKNRIRRVVRFELSIPIIILSKIDITYLFDSDILQHTDVKSFWMEIHF